MTMHFNKLIQIFGIALLIIPILNPLFSCTRKKETTTIFFSSSGSELLNGSVKEIIETDSSLTGIFSPIDTNYFDVKGNITASNGRGRLGKQLVRFTNEYGPNGQKLKTIATGYEYAFGILDNTSTTIFKYNEAEYITSLEDYCQPKHICDTTLYKYNKTNQLIEMINSNGLGIEFSENFKYNGNLLIETISYLYDHKGNKMPPDKYNYKYLTFDKKGNWTKRFGFYNSEKEWMAIRKITYY